MNDINILWNLFRLRANTKKSRAAIRRIQEKKLRKLLLYAWDHSSYYRESFEAAGISREQARILPLSAFPTMDKRILMDRFDELVTAPDLNQEMLRAFDAEETERDKLFLGKYHAVHSSGSTGKPGYFVYDDKAWSQMLLAIIRGALWDMSAAEIAGLLVHGPRIAYIAATDGRYGGAMAVGGGIEGIHGKQMFLDIKTPLGEWIRQIREFRPNIVIGYPSALKILGELAEQGQVHMDVIRVISCGEPLGASLRHYLEQAFRADVVNFYGASESLALGVETDPGDGMILFDDMNYIEVEDGVMYLTSLYNFVQPLIRYRISDQLKLKPWGEPSRYPFTKAESLLGRDEDLLWFEDGEGSRDFLHPLAIEGFCIEGLLDYRFRQTGRDSFEMEAEVSDTNAKNHIRAKMLTQMREILWEKHLEYVRFHVKFVSEILPDAITGKKRLIAGHDTEMRDAG